MIRRLTTLIAATSLAVTGLTVVAPTAQAAGSCSLYIPSRISIGTPYRAITARLGPNCSAAGVDWANWDGYHPTQGLQEILIFDGTTTTTWNLYSWEPIGRWQWRAEGAYDPDSNPVFQYGPYYTDIRLASYGRVTATRSGSRVNVRTSAYRYWGDGEKFMGWAYARGQIQYRTPGSNTWRGLKEVYSYSNGTYSYTYTTSAGRYYRVVLYDAPNKTIWGSTSPQVYR